MTLIGSTLVFLAATVVAVPLFKRLKLGAILGYLVAGIVIGPFALNAISDPETILHFAEMGVVLLLFVIGLELEPKTLWRMRNHIVFSGGSQLIGSTLLLGGIIYWLGFSWQVSMVIGLAVALSSTAFAIQLMNEQRILHTPPGQQGFSILLMQDVAVIPILLLVASLSPIEALDQAPWWVAVLAVLGVLIAGRFLINPFLRIVSRYGSTEVMTAAALLIVLLTAVAMQHAGLSMGMGAFIAGILLADSSFKHQLETEIEPFKGLLLGLFFIAIGMNLNLQLLVEKPVHIFAATVALVAIKTAVIFAVLKANKQSKTDSMRVSLMLSQGGEFAFVVMTLAVSSQVLDAEIAAMVNLVVGLSMALTSPLVILYSLSYNSRNCPAVYDSHSDSPEPQVLIAGFGRFGQITGRILAANSIAFTAMDKDAEHIEFVSQFGNKVFYGDATRLDLLRTAGIQHARTLLIAIDDADATTRLATLVSDAYPEVRIIARARNRTHAMQLARAGIEVCVREVFESAIVASKQVLGAIGYTEGQTDYMARVFAEHDAKLLRKAIEDDMSLPELIKNSEQGREELRQLFADDKREIAAG
ncbi:monovalent cation:proton antiporter-2 (CPA2) family protein [Alteromonas oceanisediminis]|uniref:monovalent cation:proton antiporter-2 (CPA2) family protein n=1 Tax=Alteromonas oceanisediminis TaxID=2836180 RepID=UPI001BDA5E1C|nr:monovalent cation:proton antiporter-2 (CPA2) family protein [Alteromonas oceanisediminis]MBT0585637.1 monovalent cation:proton antiporter-2 (CPA2) family protein [Alteromonas oceanisediminis]